MKTNAEKRGWERRNYTVPIVFSYFNQNDWFDAQSLNHCTTGLCFKSGSRLRPGATLYIRVKDFHPQGPCTGMCGGLRSTTLAEVKWCEEILDKDTLFYKVGVKYYGPIN